MSRKDRRRRLRRFGIFNLVGLIGFALQFTVLFVLKQLLGVGYLSATALAVEIALLHNFAWHEQVTWSDVVSPFRRGVGRRLARFHAANGLISIAGNLAFTAIFVQAMHWSYLLANATSVVICSLMNFAAGDRFVFRERPTEDGQVPFGTHGKVTSVFKRIGCGT